MKRGSHKETADFYRACAAKGMTIAETAKARGVTYQTVKLWSQKNPDVKFMPHKRKLAQQCPRQKLTPQQNRDVDLLIRQAGYSLEGAIRKVTSPKVKVRAPNWDDVEAIMCRTMRGGYQMAGRV